MSGAPSRRHESMLRVYDYFFASSAMVIICPLRSRWCIVVVECREIEAEKKICYGYRCTFYSVVICITWMSSSCQTRCFICEILLQAATLELTPQNSNWKLTIIWWHSLSVVNSRKLVIRCIRWQRIMGSVLMMMATEPVRCLFAEQITKWLNSLRWSRNKLMELRSQRVRLIKEWLIFVPLIHFYQVLTIKYRDMVMVGNLCDQYHYRLFILFTSWQLLIIITPLHIGNVIIAIIRYACALYLKLAKSSFVS